MSINYNYNYNYNSNINYNGNSQNVNPQEPDDDNIVIFDFTNPVRVRTANGLYIVDRGNRTIQTNDFQVPLESYWDILGTSDERRFRNRASGRYMSIEYLSNENRIEIVTLPSDLYVGTAWTIYDIFLRSGFQIVNNYSGKALDVPENSSENGVNLIQYRRKAYFESIANQQFYVEESV